MEAFQKNVHLVAQTVGRTTWEDIYQQLMQALRREDQKEADVLIAGMLTELWDALFEEEKR